MIRRSLLMRRRCSGVASILVLEDGIIMPIPLRICILIFAMNSGWDRTITMRESWILQMLTIGSTTCCNGQSIPLYEELLIYRSPRMPWHGT